MNIFSWTYFIFGMFPIVGLVLQYIKLEGKSWLYAFLVGVATCVVGFHLAAPWYTDYPVKVLYLTYGAFMLVAATLLSKKTEFLQVNWALGITLLLTFIVSEWWEWGTFIYGHLGLFGKEYFGSIEQIYVIVIFFVLVMYSRVQWSRFKITLLLIPIVVSLLVIAAYPSEIYSKNVWFIPRIVTYLCLGYVFVHGGTPHSS